MKIIIVQLIEQGQVVIPTGPMIKGSRPFYWTLLKEANLFIMGLLSGIVATSKYSTFTPAVLTKIQVSFTLL